MFRTAPSMGLRVMRDCSASATCQPSAAGSRLSSGAKVVRVTRIVTVESVVDAAYQAGLGLAPDSLPVQADAVFEWVKRMSTAGAA
jgi:hypothetical protein